MNTTTAKVKIQEEVQPRPGHSDWPQEIVEREIRPAPDRYRNALGKFRIDRLASCISCGRCAELCPHGVHIKPGGYKYMLRPQDNRCIGPECSESGGECFSQCPQKALVMRLNPNVDCLGDPRWS